MPRFKSRQSQKASEDWFRTHITKKEQVPQPRPSTDDSHSGAAEFRGAASVDERGESHAFGGGSEYPPAQYSTRSGQLQDVFLKEYSFQNSDSDSVKTKQWEEKSLENNVSESPTDDSGPSSFTRWRDEEAEPRTRTAHVVVPPRDTSRSCIIERPRDREPEDGARKDVVEVPTDALGTICFVGLGSIEAEYVRLSSDTSLDVLYKGLTEQWELDPPNLLISVTGAAKNFNLKPQVRNMFHRGLIKVAQTTGAWILTGGTNIGVAKHVGQAVRAQALSSCNSGRIVAIGMATWGTIHNRHMLVNPQGGLAKYEVDVKGQGQLRCLEHNHTHFLLVDDGTQGKYGAELKLRAQLEKYISEKELANQVSGVKIPVVLVMLNGDPDTLNTMYNAMQNGTPCVVLEGSGGMADVVAQVAELPMSQVTIARIEELMKKFFGKDFTGFSAIEVLECIKKIQDIIRMPHLLTVFRLTVDSDGHVDVAILQALLKASRNREDSESNQRQLEMAVAWNRVDIAKTEIFTDESQWTTEQLHNAMFRALVGNKPEFVSLLLENGVNLTDFFQGETLYKLYENPAKCLFRRRTNKRKRSRRATNIDQTDFTHRHREARQLLKSYTLPILPSQPVNLEEVEMSPASVSEKFLESGNPERDLFLWAILHNNKEIAEIAWEECNDSMASALAASKILKKLGRQAKREEDADEEKGLNELANHYETRAIDLFNQCYSCDEERAHKLLQRESPLWDRATCLNLALEAENQNFIAQSGVQALLTQIWCGELSVENPIWRVLVCIIFFPLIYTPFLDFRRDEEIQREAEKKEETKALKTMTKVSHEEENKEQKGQLESLGRCERLKCLYSSLQVKFYMHIVFYFAFLALFAAVLMVDFHPSPSVSEIMLYVWTFSLACEEIRQLFYDPAGLGCLKKAKLYIYDLWNVLDVLSIFLFVIGLALRLNDGLFYAGKIVLCIDFVIFCLRLMAIFTINRTLGPKIIIVRRMMRDMFFFMFLLSIWVVAYGVAKHGILIQNENRLEWILRGAVYEPYRTVFGEMPTNIDHTEFDISSCSVDGSDPLKPKCPELNEDKMPVFPQWLTIIMLCVYLLFANILLLNLLIAILSFTFQVVQDNTDRIWKFQRYELISEYHSRPIAPPPFILFCHMYEVLQAVLRRLRDACRNPRGHRGLVQQSEKGPLQGKEAEEDEQLLEWEAIMKNQQLESTKQAQIQSTEWRIQSIERKIQDTAHRVSTICDRLDRDEDPSSGSVHEWLAWLEKLLLLHHNTVRQLLTPQQRNMDSGESHTRSHTETVAPQDTPVENVEAFHVRARHSPYPGTTVDRFPVPEEIVPWEVTFDLYNPPYYPSPDTGDGMDRSEVLESDKFRNPGGRTGLRGRGVLPRLGPNRSMNLILTRRDHGKLEFLVLKDEKESLILPGGEMDSDRRLPAVLETTMGKEVCQKITEMKKIFQVYDGYEDDYRNTDNAWIEATVVTLDLTDSDLLNDISTLVTQTQRSAPSFEWHEVSGRTRLISHQRDYLRTVAQLHNSNF